MTTEEKRETYVRQMTLQQHLREGKQQACERWEESWKANDLNEETVMI